MTEFINQINEDIKEYQERYPHMANMNKNEWAFNFWVLDKLYKEDEQLKEDKIIEYIRQNGSISSQKAADIGGYKSKTGARKLLDKMIEKGLITKIGNGPATKYVI